MTLRTLFAKEVYIRLTDDEDTFVCTIQRGPFRSKPAKVSVLDGFDKEPMQLARPESEDPNQDGSLLQLIRRELFANQPLKALFSSGWVK